MLLAHWLKEQDIVSWVNYPGFETYSYYQNTLKYLPKGQSGIVTFGVNGGYEAAKEVVDNTKIFSLLANIGDTKSLIIHPASTTHQQLSDEQQKDAGVGKDLIRLSVEIEDIDDLKRDLKEAFNKISKHVLK